MKKTFVFSSDFNKRLISKLMSTKKRDASSGFALKSTHEFASRSELVFEKLQNLEKEHDVWVADNISIHCEDARNVHNTNSTVFKKPFINQPLKRFNNSSTSPKRRKWKKYSLEDVSLSSDATNAAVALQFLEELKKRNASTRKARHNKEKVSFHKKVNEEFKTNIFSSNSKKLCIEVDKHQYNTNLRKAAGCVKLSHLEDFCE